MVNTQYNLVMGIFIKKLILSNKMKKLTTLILLFLFAQKTVLSISNYPLEDQHALDLLDQAQFFAEQGVSKSEIIRIFKESLAHEEHCNARSEKTELHEKILVCVVAGVICLVIGGVIYFCIKANAAERAHRQQLAQDVTNLEQQMVLAQTRLDQANVRARAAPVDQPRHLLQADMDAQRDALNDLFQLQGRVIVARNALYEYDQRRIREQEAWSRQYERAERQRQMDRIENLLRNR